MNVHKSHPLIAALLALAIVCGLFAGCSDRDSGRKDVTSKATEPPETTAAPTEPVDEALYGASWRQVFGEKGLTEDGWLQPDEAAFFRTEEDGTASVTVMSLREMQERLDALGHLPRSDYLVDKSGVTPTFVGDLPEQCAALNRSNINVQLLTIEAARIHKKDYIYQAALMDPHTSSELDMDDTVALCDALIEAHGDWLEKYE